ncbi:hypothetical protein LNTAR_19187 [Lentisphaera araneosa HTCC2155]|uniref:Uncharacterized protein n=1 Tax=Lentisphaera araneosa HTCC2155 TaxID=313628 RepID=A6DQQ3_9BACT|nr:hypothetical protein [Lentisphaera araneosa]EDM25953.1 hypothetical protein LNTAR_19187 [Lentisphaera araneosa HTCC2155]
MNNKLKELNLPNIFQNILNGNIPVELNTECQQPTTYEYLKKEYPEDCDIHKFLIPLWETNGDSITGYLENKKVFIKHYFEDPTDKYQVLGENYNEFICELFLGYIYAGWEDDELIEINKYVEFPYLDYFLDEINTNIELEGNEWDEFITKLKLNIRTKS